MPFSSGQSTASSMIWSVNSAAYPAFWGGTGPDELDRYGTAGRARSPTRLDVGGSLQPLFQSSHVRRHLRAGLTANDQWHEELADPMPVEVKLDRDPGAPAAVE